MARELRTGDDVLPATDLLIRVDPRLLSSAYLDASLDTSNDIPSAKEDFYSVMLHEMVHAVGFTSVKNPDGTLKLAYESAYDQYVTMLNGQPYFTGPTAQSVFGGSVPLTPGNQSHYGTSVSAGPTAGGVNGIMNGVGKVTGARYDLNTLDLAILRDIGVNVSVAGDARAKLWGSTGDDALVASVPSEIRGLGGNDVLQGSSGNDYLYGGGGSDAIFGGAGLDIAVFSGSRASYHLGASSGNAQVVNSQGAATTQGVERLKFDDGWIALDLAGDGNAGAAARLMWMVLGASSLDNQALVGTITGLFDQGLTVAQLSNIAVTNGILANSAGGASNAAFIQYVYKNFVGVAPTVDQTVPFVSLLDSGALTQAQLLAIAVDHPLTRSNIEMRGMLPYTSGSDPAWMPPLDSVALVGVAQGH